MKIETLDLVTLSPSEKSVKLCDFLTSLIEKNENITDFVVSPEVLRLIEMSSSYKGFTPSQVGSTGKFKGIKIILDNYQVTNTLKICYKINLFNVI
jgi:hypothetical protein